MNGYREDDREIDLVDFFFYLLKHWKSLIVLIVLGLIAGIGYKQFKSRNTITEETAKVELKQETLMNMYLASEYYDLYTRQAEYNENSLIMQIDTNNVSTGVLKYYISSLDDTFLISNLYRNIIEKDDLYDEIVKKVKNVDAEYIKELIGCSITYENETVNIYSEVLTDVHSSKSIVTYDVKAKDDETCIAIIQVLQEFIDDLNEELETKYSNYSYEKIENDIKQITMTSLLDTQKSNVDKEKNYFNEYNKLVSEFSEEELTYFEKEYDIQVTGEEN